MKRVQGTWLNGARERVLLSMIDRHLRGRLRRRGDDDATDGDPAPGPIAAGAAPELALVEPGLGGDEDHAAPLALTPGDWLGDRAAVVTGAGRGAVAAVAQPPRRSCSAAGTLTALPRPAQIALLPPSGARLDGLASEAEVTEQARLAKRVLSARPWSTEQIVVRRGDTLMDILLRAADRARRGLCRARSRCATSTIRASCAPGSS